MIFRNKGYNLESFVKTYFHKNLSFSFILLMVNIFIINNIWAFIPLGTINKCTYLLKESKFHNNVSNIEPKGI